MKPKFKKGDIVIIVNPGKDLDAKERKAYKIGRKAELITDGDIVFEEDGMEYEARFFNARKQSLKAATVYEKELMLFTEDIDLTTIKVLYGKNN